MSAVDLSLVREFKRRAEAALPGRVARVVLFGSRARGEEHAESDWDIAVVMPDEATPSDWRALGRISFDLTTEHGAFVQVVPLTPSRLKDGSALSTSVAADGIAA